MKILVLLIISLGLPPSLCAPFRDEDPDVLDEANLPEGVHNHSDPYRGSRHFQNNEFGLGDVDVSGQVEGNDVSIGSKVDIDVDVSSSEAKEVQKRGPSVASPKDPEKPSEPKGDTVRRDHETEGNSCPCLKDAPVVFNPSMLMPKGPQGPPYAVLHYDLLSNFQMGVKYPEEEDHLGAFVPREMHEPGSAELNIPQAAQQDPGTNEITITAEKQDFEDYPTTVTSARMDTKGVWSTAQSREIKMRGYIEVRALMPAKTDGGIFKGAWPAIWMLGVNEDWPDNREIGIAKLKNGDPSVHMTLHSTSNYGAEGQHPPNNPIRLETDMTKIPTIFGLEWNVRSDDEQIDLTWYITSFDVPTQQWKSQNTTKSLLKSEDEANDYNVFLKSFNGDGFYLLINLAQEGDSTEVQDLLLGGPQHIVIESAKVYRIPEEVEKQAWFFELKGLRFGSG